MGKLLVDVDREALERLRVKLGARSHAETLRRLIEAADPQGEIARHTEQVMAPLEPYKAAGGAALEALRPKVPYGSLLKKK